MQGGGGSPEFAILGGHMDSWFGQAASDNASGNAIFLEIARVFQNHAAELKRSLTVGFWVGHETGTMIGSSHFVDTYWDDLRENGVAYVQVDQPALKGTTEWETRSDFELHDYHAAVEQRILGERLAPRVEAVHQDRRRLFFRRRSPGHRGPLRLHQGEVQAMGQRQPRLVASLHREHHGCPRQGASGGASQSVRGLSVGSAHGADPAGPLHPHREADGGPFKRACCPRVSRSSWRGQRSWRKRLCRQPNGWMPQSTSGAGRPTFPSEIEQTINGTLKGLSRILVPLGGTVAGTYGHDPYGLSAQSTLLPGLYDLPRMNSLPPQAEERELLFRELIRQRNRLADSMREARDLANRTVTTIGK